MSKYVFVYGTLKQGYGNHRLLSKEPMLRGAVTLPCRMISLGGFPALVPSDDYHEIHGEIYEVDDSTFESLDFLEGYPDFYNRDTFYWNLMDVEVWYYYIPEGYADAEPVVNNCW